MSIYNKLSDAEEERLAIHLEESGESLQEIGKIFRHGYDCWNPFDPDKVTNRMRLTKEIADLAIAAQLMMEAGDIDAETLTSCIRIKLKKMRKYIRSPENQELIQKLAVDMGVEDIELTAEELGTNLVIGKPFVALPMV